MTETPTKTPLKVRLLQLALLALVGTGIGLGIKYSRHYVIAKRFLEIEPGLFRSGQLKQWPYERVVETHGIKTVLRLNASEAASDPGFVIEDGVVAKHGLTLLHVPMKSGSGIVPFEQLDEAADYANDKSLRPMLLHCAAGDKRSSAVHGVWRMRHCGYTWEQTKKELLDFGLKAKATRLFDYLERYHNERILGKPPSEVAPVGSKTKR